MYLEEKLGVATFQKVYAYVSREENGEQESGEREAVLALLAEQKDQLPLVRRRLPRAPHRPHRRPPRRPASPHRATRDGRAQRLLGPPPLRALLTAERSGSSGRCTRSSTCRRPSTAR